MDYLVVALGGDGEVMATPAGSHDEAQQHRESFLANRRRARAIRRRLVAHGVPADETGEILTANAEMRVVILSRVEGGTVYREG